MSTSLRVLVIPSWYPSAKAPTVGIFIHEQVDVLSSVCDVAVLHVEGAARARGPVATSQDGITVIRAAVAATGLFNRFFAYRRMGLDGFDRLRDEWGMPDIIHVQALWPAAMIGRSVSRRYGIPYVVTEHSEEYLPQSERRLVRTHGMLSLVLRPLARGASRTIAVSNFLASRLVELGLAREPVVIPNVVAECVPAAAVAMSPRVIAHISVMGPAKNLPALLRAVAMLRELRSDFVLCLAGDGEQRAAAEALSAELGLSESVEFVGEKSADAVRDLLARSAFTVISSTHETFSVVAAESLMCGRPVLSTRCGGPEEFITPEVGCLVDNDDVSALTDGLDWMLDHHSDYDPQALHEYASKRFSPDVVVQQILEVYRSVLDA